MAEVDGGQLPAAVEQELGALVVLRDRGRLTADEFERRAVVVVCKAAALWDRGTPRSRPTPPVVAPMPAVPSVSAPNSTPSVAPLAANLWMAAQQLPSDREPVAATV